MKDACEDQQGDREGIRLFSLQESKDHYGEAEIDQAPHDREDDARDEFGGFVQCDEPSGIRVGQESSDHADDRDGQKGDNYVDKGALPVFHKSILCKKASFHTATIKNGSGMPKRLAEIVEGKKRSEGENLHHLFDLRHGHVADAEDEGENKATFAVVVASVACGDQAL